MLYTLFVVLCFKPTPFRVIFYGLNMVKKKNVHALLANPDRPFLERLIIAASNNLKIAKDKKDNLSNSEFIKFLQMLPKDLEPNWVLRKSIRGPHGISGQKKCFLFGKTIEILGRKKSYFCKGYFFDEDNLNGVYIQSFREEKIKLVI